MNLQYRIIKKIDENIWKLKEKNISFTLINSNKTLDFREIEIATYLAMHSFKNNSISNRFENEFLIKLSGKRQIKDAINEYGVKKEGKIIFVYFGDEKIEEMKTKYKLELKEKFEKKILDQELFKKLEEKAISLIKD